MTEVLNNRFELLHKIGSGGFGTVYLGFDLLRKKKVAIKFQRKLITSEEKSTASAISTASIEYKTLEHLQTLGAGEGFPEVYYFHEPSKEKDDEYFVMELCGPSIWDLFHKCNKSFTLKTILLIADQLIVLLQQLHTAGYLHRDIKPDNILMGLSSKSDILHLVDFGLATKCEVTQKIPEIGKFYPPTVVGTLMFASVSGMRGGHTHRRDDMEVVEYILLYLLSGGELPWINLKSANTQQLDEKVTEMKLTIPPEKLFAGLPFEFPLYCKMIKELHCDDVPQYSVYRRLFRNLAYCLGYQYDGRFDWKVRAVWNGEDVHIRRRASRSEDE
ncbi:unnamed protein product [Orchesella dallaii]|uniref:non-specific serine/threonine protein kinase n=1 Tax=Orchesella dallaii TaxID=48710 RepID=A0ABP1QX15_9HEXA